MIRSIRHPSNLRQYLASHRKLWHGPYVTYFSRLNDLIEADVIQDIGVPAPIAQRLLEHYPHIRAPTPAQRAFLLSVFRGQDVFLRDDMGRGK